MKQVLFLYSLGVSALLQSGCQPVTDFVVFNNTGLTIEVAEGGQTTTVPDGASFAVGSAPGPEDQSLAGPTVKIAGRSYFYAFAQRRGTYQWELHSPPYEYWRRAGFNRLEKVLGLGRTGEIFALEKGVTSYKQNRQPQPAGFPVRPDA